MNFHEFQATRTRVLSERRDVIDCAETNLYSSLADLIPPASVAAERTVHRCRLASEWIERFGFPAEDSRRALISCGVRHSLDLLFRTCAAQGGRLWLPADNYPVYGELARVSGLAYSEFATLPEPAWPNAEPVGGLECLVVTNPLKPLGRWLTSSDVASLRAWLTASPQRRVVLDAVYTFETKLHATTMELLATGQVILLHSLTKGWLHPRLFGIALVPDSDAALLTPVFRAEPPPQENLARARELMASYADVPLKVADQLVVARRQMANVLGAKAEVDFDDALAPGYFQLTFQPWGELLETKGILGIPPSVFGSGRMDFTVLSSLKFTQPK